MSDADAAAGVYRCTPADFPHVAYFADPAPTWPHVLVVAGGPQYGERCGAWVYTQILSVGASLHGRCRVQVECAPTAGAAALAYRECQARRRPVGMTWLRTDHGRAAASRCAWDLLCHADSVLLFEPLDDVAAHVARLAACVETRWGRGLRVRRVPPRGDRSTSHAAVRGHGGPTA